MTVCIYNKKYSETLLCMLERFRIENPIYQHEKITYAGRLDPLAEGVMILLTGEDVHQKNNLLGLSKEYIVDVVLGVSTDSYDILGLVQKKATANAAIVKKVLEDRVKSLVDLKEQEYPVYSSKTVQGKPLWLWAREGRLSEITIPKTQIHIYSAEIIDFFEYKADSLQRDIHTAIDAVKGDFRQKDILRYWDNYFNKNKAEVFQSFSLKLEVSSGTYIRGLVNFLGESLDQQGAVSLRIHRTRIGSYTQNT